MAFLRKIKLAIFVALLVLPMQALALTANCYYDPLKLGGAASHSFINDKEGLGDSVITIEFEEGNKSANIATKTGEKSMAGEAFLMQAKDGHYAFNKAVKDDKTDKLTVYVLRPEKKSLVVSTFDFRAMPSESGMPEYKASMAYCDIQ